MVDFKGSNRFYAIIVPSDSAVSLNGTRRKYFNYLFTLMGETWNSSPEEQKKTKQNPLTGSF